MSTKERIDKTEGAHASLHWPALVLAIGIMLIGSIYPIAFLTHSGELSHSLAALACWAMSAGFIRGVGFVPRFWLWRGLFSFPAMIVMLTAAAVLRFL